MNERIMQDMSVMKKHRHDTSSSAIVQAALCVVFIATPPVVIYDDDIIISYRTVCVRLASVIYLRRSCYVYNQLT